MHEFGEVREIYGERWRHGAMNKSSSIFSIPGPTYELHALITSRGEAFGGTLTALIDVSID